VAHHADDDSFPKGFAKLSFRDFTLQAGFVSREKGIPTASYGTVFDTDRTRSIDEHAYVNLGFEHHLSDELQLSGRVSYDRFYYQGDYLYDVPPLILNRDEVVGEWFGTEFKLDKRLRERHKITLGAEFRENFRQDLENFDTDPRIPFLDEQENSRNWAVFAQDEFSILSNLLFNAGVRYDYYDSFGGTVNPRLALIYNLDKTTIKALYGQAFRAPNAYEEFYLGTGFKASNDLEPETIRTYELVLERHVKDRVRASVAGYFYRIDNLISLITDPSDGFLVFENAEDIEAKGLELELELEGEWPLGIDGRLSYAIQQTENLETHKRLTNSPQHLVKLNLVVPIIERKLSASLDMQYTSRRKTLAGDSTGGFSTTNVTLFSQNMIRGLEVSGGIFNLFDKEYGDPGSGEHRQNTIEQDGRTFWLKIKYGF
jgi:iron complex outermembrane receptor protein